jgi:hypothetical protein
MNSNNTLYDQFYIINHSEPGKDWKELSEKTTLSDVEESQDMDGQLG